MAQALHQLLSRQDVHVQPNRHRNQLRAHCQRTGSVLQCIATRRRCRYSARVRALRLHGAGTVEECSAVGRVAAKGCQPRSPQHLADKFTSWCVNRPESGEAGFSIFEKATGFLMGPVTLYGCALPHHVADLAVMIGPGYVDRESGTRAAKRL